MSFAWTAEGRMLLRLYKDTPKSADFAIRQDGYQRWVFLHYRYKGPAATFTGDNATQALKALKTALITYRLMR